MKTQSSKPWLDQNGKIFSDKEIKSISKEWSAETWEAFLQATVERNLSDQEVLLSDYERLCEECAETISEEADILPEAVKRKVHMALRELAPTQHAVIDGLFFRKLSQAQIAAKLNISRQTVNETKKLSLRKIKSLLENDPDIASYLIGGHEKTSLPKTRSEEIKEVYREDLKGSYLT